MPNPGLEQLIVAWDSDVHCTGSRAQYGPVITRGNGRLFAVPILFAGGRDQAHGATEDFNAGRTELTVTVIAVNTPLPGNASSALRAMAAAADAVAPTFSGELKPLAAPLACVKAQGPGPDLVFAVNNSSCPLPNVHMTYYNI